MQEKDEETKKAQEVFETNCLFSKHRRISDIALLDGNIFAGDNKGRALRCDMRSVEGEAWKVCIGQDPDDWEYWTKWLGDLDIQNKH